MDFSKKLDLAIENGATVHIGVEGIDFMHLLRERIKGDPQYSKVWMWDFESDSVNRKKWLRAIKAQSDRGINSIGIICDVDCEGNIKTRQDRVKSTQAMFKDEFSIQLQENTVSSINNFSYGFCVIPSDPKEGCLETALLENYNSSSRDCVEDFVKCLDSVDKSTLVSTVEKRKVRSIILAEDPSLSYGATANKNLWGWNQGSLADMMKFIKDMNDSG